MANTPPWVRYFSDPFSSVESTPTLILQKEHVAQVRSLLVTNTSNQDIFITVFAEQTRIVDEEDVTTPTIRNFKYPLKIYESADLINQRYQIFLPGDKVYIYSDLSGNTFDGAIDGVELLELPQEE